MALGVAQGDELQAAEWIDKRLAEAVALVELKWLAIVALADRLIKCKAMTGAEVAEFVTDKEGSATDHGGGTGGIKNDGLEFERWQLGRGWFGDRRGVGLGDRR